MKNLTTVALCLSILSAATQERSEQFPFLKDLNQEILLGESVDLSTMGLRIDSLQGIECDAELVKLCTKHRGTKEFKEKLISLLSDRTSWYGAYALLNQLYPEHELEITVPHLYPLEKDEYTPILFRSETHAMQVLIRIETFGAIARDYWSEKLLEDRFAALPEDLRRRAGSGRWKISDEPVRPQKSDP